VWEAKSWPFFPNLQYFFFWAWGPPPPPKKMGVGAIASPPGADNTSYTTDGLAVVVTLLTFFD